MTLSFQYVDQLGVLIVDRVVAASSSPDCPLLEVRDWEKASVNSDRQYCWLKRDEILAIVPL